MGWSDTLPADAASTDELTADDAAEARFVAFVEKHRETVYRVARQMVSTHDDADDVVQETFLRAYEALPRFRGDAELDTWVYRIVMNVSRNALRARSRRRRLLAVFGREAPVLGRQPVGPGDGMERREARDRVVEALDSLPGHLKEVVVLFDLEGLAGVEVAQVLGVAPGTVRSRLHQARRRLRSALTPYMFGNQ